MVRSHCQLDPLRGCDGRRASLASATRWMVSCAEQAAQKALKAFLIGHGYRSVPIHSVAQLAERCAQIDLAFAVDITAGRMLDQYDIPTRYPDVLAPPAYPLNPISRSKGQQRWQPRKRSSLWWPKIFVRQRGHNPTSRAIAPSPSTSDPLHFRHVPIRGSLQYLPQMLAMDHLLYVGSGIVESCVITLARGPDRKPVFQRGRAPGKSGSDSNGIKIVPAHCHREG
jgi:HEPN domain-containing protein